RESITPRRGKDKTVHRFNRGAEGRGTRINPKKDGVWCAGEIVFSHQKNRLSRMILGRPKRRRGTCASFLHADHVGGRVAGFYHDGEAKRGVVARGQGADLRRRTVPDPLA